MQRFVVLVLAAIMLVACGGASAPTQAQVEGALTGVVLHLSIVDNSDPSGQAEAAPAYKDLNSGAVNDADVQLIVPGDFVFRIRKT